MSYDSFLYELRDTMIGEKMLRFSVKLGYYEPKRWKQDDGSYSPGMAFAASTNIDVEDKGLWDDDGVSQGREMKIQVAQTGNSLVSIEEAEERHEVNVQALQLAYFVRDQLDMEVGLAELVAFLKFALKVGESVPINRPFRYTGGVKASLKVFSHEEVERKLYGN